MNEHPTDLLPGFALGVLNLDEAILVAEHLKLCSVCRAEVKEFQEVVRLLPYSTKAEQPPPHVKRKLFDRIRAIDNGPLAEPIQKRRSSVGRLIRGVRWMHAVTMLSLALTLVLGIMTLDSNARLQAATLESQQQEQKIAFLAAPGTIGWPLTAQTSGVEGKMYMQRGHKRLMLIIHGLQPLAKDKIYQFWLAMPNGQIPSKIFTVGQGGIVELIIDAPEPIDDYTQVMVTVEHTGGSIKPSDQIVLAASVQQNSRAYWFLAPGPLAPPI